ncbi:zinc finger protein OZF-like isoform X12 [Onthophagus taurus]|uniref:zinc finger protein OZF-like isoform X12 n=1 Tax=Onthophagus taurus TaxID=166361 RepID=UPI0039BDE26A
MMGTMSSIKEIMQFCRLCLVKDQVNVSIFEEHGDTRDVKRKISECLPVTVSEEDSLPKKICDGCLYKLELLYQFRTTCVSAEKQLQVWIAELNNSESKEDQDLKLQHSQTSVKEEIFDATDHPDNSEYVIEEQHISYEEGDIPYNESQDDNDDGDATNSSDDEPLAKRRKRFLEEQVQTDDTLKTADNKMAITKLEHESDDENVDDPEPNFVSVGTSDDQQPGPSGLNKMSATTTNAEMPTNLKQKEDVVKNTSCNRCNKSYSTRRAYTKHRHRCNKIKSIPCNICEKLFKTFQERNRHVKALHNENRNVYACDICDEFFLTTSALERHENKHLNKHKFQCDECGKKFHIKSSLNHHIALQHKGVRYTCEECGKSFASEPYFRKHCVTHKEDYVPPNFHCLECGKIYNRKSSLAMHIQIHRDPSKKFFVCEVCGKSVASKTSLKQHVMLHTGEKPFKCDVCGKSFNKQTICKSHMRTHTKSKPFICNICGKGFSQRTPLTVHLRYHSGEKPFTCLVCQKTFYTRTLLKTHSKIHGIPLSCF